MVELGQIGGRLAALAVRGRHLFVAVGPRLIVLDIADPYAPRQVGASPELPGVASDLAFDGDILWATFVGGLLVALDVADPEHPDLIETHQLGSPWTSAGAERLGFSATEIRLGDGVLAGTSVDSPLAPRRPGDDVRA